MPIKIQCFWICEIVESRFTYYKSVENEHLLLENVKKKILFPLNGSYWLSTRESLKDFYIEYDFGFSAVVNLKAVNVILEYK